MKQQNTKPVAPIKEVQEKIDKILQAKDVEQIPTPPSSPKPSPPPPPLPGNKQPPDINNNLKFVSHIFKSIDTVISGEKFLFYDDSEKAFISNSKKALKKEFLESLNKACIDFIYKYSKLLELPEGNLKEFMEAQDEIKNMKLLDTEGNEVVAENTPQQTPMVYQ